MSLGTDSSSPVFLNFLALPLVPSDRGSDNITRVLFSLEFLSLEGQTKMTSSLICHLTLPNSSKTLAFFSITVFSNYTLYLEHLPLPIIHSYPLARSWNILTFSLTRIFSLFVSNVIFLKSWDSSSFFLPFHIFSAASVSSFMMFS